ncbi:alanine racemase [Ascidiimonas aurantiaca]|uniref:alanine racemase n=1 Tax=Ascidiimonas aurantiaca TaxID=1685432 RepID=UPI0030EBDE48
MISSTINHFQKDIDRVNHSKARLLLDRNAVIHNLEQIKNNSKPAHIMAVLKGNAYGIGIKNILPLVAPYARAYAVDNLAEAIELRKLGVQKKILVFEGGIRDCLDLSLQYHLTPGICDTEQLLAYDQMAKTEGPIPVWLLTNIGFNRSGYREDKMFEAFVKKAASCKNLSVEAVYAHMTNAHADTDISRRQIDIFFSRIKMANKILQRKVATSLFASHAILRWAEKYPTTWVRPGLIMYGEHIYDLSKLSEEEKQYISVLKPALSLQARIMSLVSIPSDQYLGYNQTVHVKKGTRLANIGIGFGKGFPSGNLHIPVLLRDTITHTWGAAGMDISQIDVTRILDAKPLDWVTFFGKSGKHFLPLSTFLNKANVSPYQFLTGLRVITKTK